MKGNPKSAHERIYKINTEDKCSSSETNCSQWNWNSIQSVKLNSSACLFQSYTIWEDSSPATRGSDTSSLCGLRPGREVCCGKPPCRCNNPHPLLQPKLEDCPSLDEGSGTISTAANPPCTTYVWRLLPETKHRQWPFLGGFFFFQVILHAKCEATLYSNQF